MNIWEAKYKALVAGIDNQEYIDNAERMVEAVQRLTASGTISTFDQNVQAMLAFVASQKLFVIYKTIKVDSGKLARELPRPKPKKHTRQRPRGGMWQS